MAKKIEIRHATDADLRELVPLFDAYRQCYGQPSAPERGRRFLLQRIDDPQTVIFIALVGDNAIGFAQLYPNYSSRSMAQILMLNDVFVVPEARRIGVASGLIRAAIQYGQMVGAIRIDLSIDITTNPLELSMKNWVGS